MCLTCLGNNDVDAEAARGGPICCRECALIRQELNDSAVADERNAVGGAVLKPNCWCGGNGKAGAAECCASWHREGSAIR